MTNTLITWTLLFGASTGAAPAQDAAPAATTDAAWRPVDEVVFQAGDEPITLSDVYGHYARTRQRLNISVTTEAEQMELMNRSLESLVTLALEAQAGEDKDADPIGLEDRISRFLQARRQDRSLVDYVDGLEQAGMSAQGELDVNKAGYYQSSFRSQGKSGPRPTRDGYVRPGELRELYRTSSQDLLGSASSYQFQDLVLTSDQVGGVAEARELVEELRQRLLDGEDFGEIHDEYGTTEQQTRGVTELFTPENPVPNAEIREFGETGRIGDISQVIAIPDPRDPSRTIAFRVLRIVDKIPGAPPPPFATAPAQESLRTWFEEQRDDAWLTVARAKLHRTAFLWPDERDR